MLPANPLLLSVTVRVPVNVPPAVGENVTLMVQELPTAKLTPQLLACAKLLLLVTMLATVSGAPPVLLRVTG